jgi:hydrogenase nickel incorporation protein HypA/HybF
MHELAVTESILNIAQKHAVQANAIIVTDIYIVIGKFSSIVDDSIQFYWDIISKNTICENSKLHFDRRPAKFLCLDCGHEFEFTDEIMPCPACTSIRLKLLSGEEFWLESIEIER